MDQQTLVMRYIAEHGSITSQEAFDMGITRLADVIYKMKKKCIPVKVTMVHGKNRFGRPITYARYYL